MRIGVKFENKFGKNVSKIHFRNNQLPFFTFHTLFFISIKLISISRLKFGLDIFNISEIKRSEQDFHISKEQACSKYNFKHKVIGVG